MARTRDEAAFAAKKTLILRAAEALFVEKGFHKTGIAALCKALEMSPGALYRYFPSKTDIIRAIVEDDVEQQRAQFQGVAEAPDFLAALTDAVVITTLTVREPSYRKLALEIAAEAERDPEIGALLERASAEAHEELRAAFARGLERGVLRPDLDPDDTTHMLLVWLDGATSSTLPVMRLRRATGEMLTRWLT